MANIKFGDKEYKVKYGYKATLKANVLSKLVSVETGMKDESIENIERFLLYIPELLLAGLQTFHSDEFGYDLDTGEGKAEKLDKVFDMVDGYADEGGNIAELFATLQKELEQNSFLSQMLDRMMAEEKKGKTSLQKAKSKN